MQILGNFELSRLDFSTHPNLWFFKKKFQLLQLLISWKFWGISMIRWKIKSHFVEADRWLLYIYRDNTGEAPNN